MAKPTKIPRAPWLLLIHQLPPTPSYLRVKVRRRLHRFGAVALKQTVYALPNTDEALEDLQWLRQEIEAAGGSAIIAESRFIEGISDAEIRAAMAGEPRPARAVREKPRGPDVVKPGRTWVTRRDVHVDRIASAWLIRRFIDRKARFRFVPARGWKQRRGELRFDMSDAEYTHAGEDCTFETLVKRFALRDEALIAIGEIVHDIDLKDGKFGRAEAPGIASLIAGIAQRHREDEVRLLHGSEVFESLYEHFGRKRT